MTIYNPFNLSELKDNALTGWGEAVQMTLVATGGLLIGNVISNGLKVLGGKIPFTAGMVTSGWASAFLKIITAKAILPFIPIIKDNLPVTQAVVLVSAVIDIAEPFIPEGPGKIWMLGDWAEFIGIPNTTPDNANLPDVPVNDYNEFIDDYMDDDEVLYD